MFAVWGWVGHAFLGRGCCRGVDLILWNDCGGWYVIVFFHYFVGCLPGFSGLAVFMGCSSVFQGVCWV